MTLSILKNQKVKEKYIRVCEGNVRIKIERAGVLVFHHIPIRKYPSLDAAIQAAIEWRDRKHMSLFGVPVPKRILHLSSRGKNSTQVDTNSGESLPALPAGISYGYHSGRLLYVVASYQSNNKPVRKRFSIKKLGLDEAISQALSFRKGLFESSAL